MLFCIKNVRNLFSYTNDNKNSASTLSSYPGKLFFSVCLHWFSKQRQHSHPFVQQQLFRSRDPSLNLVGRPVFSLCKTEKIHRTGLKKKKTHFRCANVRGLWGSIHRNLLFYSSASSQGVGGKKSIQHSIAIFFPAILYRNTDAKYRPFIILFGNIIKSISLQSTRWWCWVFFFLVRSAGSPTTCSKSVKQRWRHHRKLSGKPPPMFKSDVRLFYLF